MNKDIDAYLQKLYWQCLCYITCRSLLLHIERNDSIMHVGKQRKRWYKRLFSYQTRYGKAASAGDFGESRVVLNQHKLRLLVRYFFLFSPNSSFSFLHADFNEQNQWVTQTPIATYDTKLGRRRICSNHWRSQEDLQVKDSPIGSDIQLWRCVYFIDCISSG